MFRSLTIYQLTQATPAVLRRLETAHGENVHAKEYRAALTLIDAHVEIWAPVADAPDQAA